MLLSKLGIPDRSNIIDEAGLVLKISAVLEEISAQLYAEYALYLLDMLRTASNI